MRPNTSENIDPLVLPIDEKNTLEMKTNFFFRWLIVKRVVSLRKEAKEKKTRSFCMARNDLFKYRINWYISLLRPIYPKSFYTHIFCFCVEKNRTSRSGQKNIAEDSVLISKCTIKILKISKCSSLVVRRTRSTLSSIVVERLPGKQDMQGSIPCEGDNCLFRSVIILSCQRWNWYRTIHCN